MAEKLESKLSLASTARWTASARAKESRRQDRLFNDPWAAALAGAEGAAWLEQQKSDLAPMIVRTHYFDGFLQDATHGRKIRQIVILAAGLDTRAYRLAWPKETHLFELDQAVVLQFKKQVLETAGAQPTCNVTTIPADLTEPWQEALKNSGFDPLQPCAWLLEGFLFYLPNEFLERILAQVSALAAPGSRMGFDIVNSTTLTSPITKAWIEMQAKAGAPWLGSLDDPEAFLAGLGWQTELSQPGSPDAHFERWTLPVIPLKMANMPHNWYVTATRQAKS